MDRLRFAIIKQNEIVLLEPANRYSIPATTKKAAPSVLIHHDVNRDESAASLERGLRLLGGSWRRRLGGGNRGNHYRKRRSARKWNQPAHGDRLTLSRCTRTDIGRRVTKIYG